MKNITEYIETLFDDIESVKVIIEDNKPMVIRTLDFKRSVAVAANFTWSYQNRHDEVYERLYAYGFKMGDFIYKEVNTNLPKGWK